MNTSTVLEEALTLARNGIPVFPCYAIGSGVSGKGRILDKSPRITGWATASSTDEGVIAKWWKSWPDALIGVPTGARSGLFVLDIDNKKGKDGAAELAKKQLILPETRINWTHSGGQHALYLVPPSGTCPTNSDVIARGVDLRGDGGYIIWWPAHGCAVTHKPLVPAPQWMTQEAPMGPAMEPMGLSDEDIDDLLGRIDPARMESRSEWIKLGMALHHETAGDAYGLQMWDVYSAKWPKYDGYESVKREWDTFGRGQRTHVTMRSFVPLGWRRKVPNPTEVFGGGAASAAVQDEVRDYLTVQQQVELFNEFTYIHTTKEIIGPKGVHYDMTQFNIHFGGYTFAMGNGNDRTTRKAWEAFTEASMPFRRVYGTAFRPEVPSGAIIMIDEHPHVNTYYPANTRSIDGDPQPFLTLVDKLLPNKRDQRILMTYMAAVLRSPGYKVQWWPVLQGTEGNGKSAFIRIMTKCVGECYSHTPNVGYIAKNGLRFNSWVDRKLFLGFEEVYVPNRRDFMEEMKAMVTNDRLQLERKGKDQVMCDNRANAIMCTNHQDGVPITVDMRRYSVFYTAQQSAADKIRDGMGGDYFHDFYNWLNGKGKYEAGGEGYGYAVVNYYLRNIYTIDPEFDPTGMCQIAPATSSQAAAVKAGYGNIEQEILEAIESEEEPGMRGGWVSSKAIKRLLSENKRHMNMENRRKMMEGLGYVPHPGLKDGRATHATMVSGDKGSKVVLYVKKDAAAAHLTDPSAIMAAYIKAQGV
jgi:hypothetical protein